MKALVYTGPKTLAYREEPDPEPRAGESLVRVHSVGVCGSDMHAYLGHDERRMPPLILGHEAAGIVEAGTMAGRRVTINPLVTCGKCRACREGRNNLCSDRQIISMRPRPGAFAEFVAIPSENLIEIPDDVSFETACLAEPLACGWHAVRLALDHDAKALRSGPCLVIGGGAIGLGTALALHAAGASQVLVAETNHERHAAIESAGPFTAFDPAGTSMLDPGTAAVVIDGAGFGATRAMASRFARPGGIILHIGLGNSEPGLDIRLLTLQEIAFVGTYTYTPQDFRDTAAAIFDGRLGRLDWPQSRRLSEGGAAFADILAGTVSAPKIVLLPDSA